MQTNQHIHHNNYMQLQALDIGCMCENNFAGNGLIYKDNRFDFCKRVVDEYKSAVKHNKISLQKLAAQYELYNANLIKEMTELAIVIIARNIAESTVMSNEEKYNEIVKLYERQANLSQRTSQSIIFQQYSTPAPISYIASSYVAKNNTSSSQYFEPSAGNGLLTIALPTKQTIVNEVDDIRLDNLKYQPYKKVTNQDATQPFTEYYKKFDGIVTNPPFGTMAEAVIYDGYPIKTLDHLMSLRALDTMKDDGRAAIIIGGHTEWDEKGRIQAGKNRIYFNYLYSHYNVDDVILIDGHKLYSRQGTAFNVRLILINGRKQKNDEFAPRKNELNSQILYDFQSLWNRVYGSLTQSKTVIDTGSKIKLLKLKALAKLKLLSLNEKPQQKAKISVTEFKLEDIETDVKRFQNRNNAFSDESRLRIIDAVKRGTFSWAKFDPIIIWKDTKDGKYYVLSGHSRLAAFKHLRNEKFILDGFDFRTIPVKIFVGTETEAIETALNSNTLSTKETEVERALYYSRSRQICEMKAKGLTGRSQCEIEVEQNCRQNEGKNANYVINLSYLNPDGYLMDNLKALGVEKDNDSTNVLRTIANWIGEARRNNKEITDLHETEIAKYLINGGYGNKSNQFKNKTQFNERLEYSFSKWKAAGSDDSKPLNLANTLSKTSFESEYDQRLAIAKGEYDEAVLQHQEKYNKYLIAVLDGEITQGRMDELMKPLILYVEKTKNEYEKVKATKGDVIKAAASQTSLFGDLNGYVQTEVLSVKNEYLGTKTEAISSLVNKYYNNNISGKSIVNAEKNIKIKFTSIGRKKSVYGRKNKVGEIIKIDTVIATAIHYLPQLLELSKFETFSYKLKPNHIKMKGIRFWNFRAKLIVDNKLYNFVIPALEIKSKEVLQYSIEYAQIKKSLVGLKAKSVKNSVPSTRDFQYKDNSKNSKNNIK